MNVKKQWIVRVLIGGMVGLLVAVFCHQPLFSGGFSAPALSKPLIQMCGPGWAVIITDALFFALGAAAGGATLPFAEDGKRLVIQSLAHFAVTAVFWSLLLGLCLGIRGWQSWLLGEVFLLLIYLLVWLGRWIGWYAEVAAIRKKLGLAPGPTFLKWKETLPYLPFVLLLCDALPAVLRVFDPVDVPALTSLLLPFVLLPVGGFFSGLSLGKRRGGCPLYPVACGIFYLPNIYFLYYDPVIFHCAIVFCAALIGNLAGAGYVWVKRKRKAP